jgi:hypothetical protein
MKKDKERTIFDLVYSARAFDSVTPTEEPDFTVKNADGEFGVEITEFYFSHSEARIKNIPGYAQEILEGKKYRHKDDVVPLEVKEFTVLPGDNRRPSFKVEGLLRQLPSIDEYVKKIAELIARKNRRFKHYITRLNHVNLIILDEERRLVGVPKDGFHRLFFQPELEKALMNADFREVFFVTELGEHNASQTVYIPLKMLFLVAEIYFLNYMLVKEYPDTPATPLLYAEYLLWRGAKNIYFKYASDGFEVVYGNSGIFIANDGRVNIRDHNDFALSGDFTLMTPSREAHFFDDTFVSSFEKYKRECVFSTQLCFDVVGSTR